MDTTNTTITSQREASIVAFAQAASTMFAMAPMLGCQASQLKMRRLDAYGVARAKPLMRSENLHRQVSVAVLCLNFEQEPASVLNGCLVA